MKRPYPRLHTNLRVSPRGGVPLSRNLMSGVRDPREHSMTGPYPRLDTSRRVSFRRGVPLSIHTPDMSLMSGVRDFPLLTSSVSALGELTFGSRTPDTRAETHEARRGKSRTPDVRLMSGVCDPRKRCMKRPYPRLLRISTCA